MKLTMKDEIVKVKMLIDTIAKDLNVPKEYAALVYISWHIGCVHEHLDQVVFKRDS